MIKSQHLDNEPFMLQIEVLAHQHVTSQENREDQAREILEKR